MASPLRNTPRSDVAPRASPRRSSRAPSGVNQPMSSTSDPWMGRPWKKRRRRNTGWSRRSSISRLGEREQRLVVGVELPVEPGDLVVLAVGVVVAALGAADLVAAEQHRHALRQEQRGEEVALLPRAQRDDRRRRRSGPRRRSSTSGCRRCRRGCPRRWPRCACRRRRRGRARVKPSWAVTKLIDWRTGVRPSSS